MNKAVYAIIGIVVLALGGGLLLSGGDDDDTSANTTPNSNSSSMMQTEQQSSSQAESEIALESTGNNQIQDYSPEALAASETEDNLVFFHAAWCTVCESVRRNVEAGSIPDSLSIFQVDYDSDVGQELARTYNIGPQFTMVQVNPDGSQIGQWVNQFGDGIDDIVGNLI